MSQYVTAHYVDAHDGISATVAPLRNGPALPSPQLSITHVDRRQDPALIVGTLPDGAPVPNAATVITQTEYNAQVADYTQWRISITVAQAETAIQRWLDQTAQDNGYQDMNSCVSYLNSGITQWAADAKAGSAWRDALWQAAFNWQARVAATPPDPIPSVLEILNQLPQPADYGWVTHAPGA